MIDRTTGVSECYGMKCRNATKSDVESISQILNDNGLPSNDCGQHIENFVVLEKNGEIIGVGGAEVYGVVGLIRSLAIVSGYRGKRAGKIILKYIEDKARSLGVRTLYLLTESATAYFQRLGFQTQKRSEVPLPIRETMQFRGLCPASAVVMFREI